MMHFDKYVRVEAIFIVSSQSLTMCVMKIRFITPIRGGLRLTNL